MHYADADSASAATGAVASAADARLSHSLVYITPTVVTLL